jgi:SSS family solute:Na+ symporter
MTIILVGIALYTILGGMLAVLVTDYLQYVVMGIGLISVSILLVYKFGWMELLQSLEQTRGEIAYNPFSNGTYGFDRIMLDLLSGFASVLTWQTMISRVLSAKDSLTGQKIYQGTSPFFLVRFTIPVLMGIAALHYFGPDMFQDNVKLAMPGLLAAVVPVGLIGILVAAMLAADMSTNSSYMIAWSSVIYNDIMKPIHKGLWSNEKAIRWNRVLIAFIGLFLLLYGLWYPLKGDLWVYMQVTGTVYLASMSVILIAACYWKDANNWGAFAAIIIGSAIPIGFLVMQQLESTQETAMAIGPYKVGVATYLLTAVAMVLGSWLKSKTVKR